MKKLHVLLSIVSTVSIALLAAPLLPAMTGPANPKVLIKTEFGDIAVEICQDGAPVTASNFLRYVDAGLYDGSVFHRTVTLDNQPTNAVKIEVIQGGQLAAAKSFPAILLERTSVTGIKHLDGVISMARSGPDTATSSFFFGINDQPSLDYGGQRNADGQGFAAFGRVVAGMEVVRKIQKQPAEGQNLKPQIKIISIRRIEKQETQYPVTPNWGHPASRIAAGADFRRWVSPICHSRGRVSPIRVAK